MSSKRKPLLLHTARLSLRGISDEDKEGAIALFTNAEVAKTYMLPNFKSKKDAIKLFHRISELSHSAERFVYGIYLENTFIGLINEVDKNETEIELGYAIHPDKKNNGFATEALAASIEALFDMGYSIVRAGAFAHNIASIRVMEKCSMHRTYQDEDLTYRDHSYHCINYAIQKQPCR